LLTTPLLLPRDSAALRLQAEEYVRSQARRRNLQLASAAAQAWVQAAPSEPRAHAAFANVLLAQGRLAEAQAEISRLKPRGVTESLVLFLHRMEIAYRTGSSEAPRLYDSLRVYGSTLAPGSRQTIGSVLAGFGPAFGRLTEFDSIWSARFRQAGQSDLQVRTQLTSIHALVGARADSLAALERQLFDQSLVSGNTVTATRTIGLSLMWALRTPRSAWPPIDTMVRAPRYQPALALSRGDTVKLRAAARMLDSLVGIAISTGLSDSGFALIAADAYVTLRDSAAALRVLRRSLDSVSTATSMFPTNPGLFLPSMYVPRMTLMRADLAAAAGQRDEARVWYKRFVDLWSKASPEVQPLVERARKSYAAMGGS
jgi:hypothetical protein